MNPSPGLYKLLKSFEGCRLKAYLDDVGVPTIGWGTVRYPDGSRVQELDTITQEQADQYLAYEVGLKAAAVNGLGIGFNQNQFDALTDFAYNEGVTALTKSTLIKKARKNPNDPSIRDEFLKWSYAGHHLIEGLKRRREAEADLYFQ